MYYWTAGFTNIPETSIHIALLKMAKPEGQNAVIVLSNYNDPTDHYSSWLGLGPNRCILRYEMVHEAPSVHPW